MPKTKLENIEFKLQFLQEMVEPPLTQIVEVMLEMLELQKEEKKIGFKSEKEK